MIEPIKIDHVGLSDNKLISELLVQVVLKLLLALGKDGDFEGFVLDILLLLFDEATNFIDCVALKGVIFIEFEVV
jgi:hypothetical protein